MDSQSGRIVVGYDGSQDSSAALDWAATQAQRRGLPLTILTVVDYLGHVPAALPTVPMPHRVEQSAGSPAEQVAAEGIHRARKNADSIDIAAITHVSRVAHSLIENSRGAALLVVGTRRNGTPGGTFLGSVASAVTGHAHCPVVVVRGDVTRPPGPDRPVVVGIDASPDSDAALRFAADSAASDGAALVVVTAYQSISSQVWAETGDRDGSDRAFDDAARQAAEVAAEAAVQRAMERRPDLDVTHRIIDGSPPAALTAAAFGAGLLVVGARGHGGFAGLKLGSVSYGVVHSAPCPVAVIHGPTPSDSADVQVTDAGRPGEDRTGGAR